ncbi:stalk domain-containing protein [Pseudobacteroides cellulosolvens]|uniref:Copper amine oxidase-like domain-containing protein n=1 Tax=Pseudobacteroides cellulosolvens ATCC 35603 = DSM 2933 TaxID=398512 RepID=A0A0L6JUC3_9FIRM|nr:stalk domain-containing protein [Pseudobacteroides cellulosolvens]KNY29245.1 copper amine oxidase-like domain-containing protein [Pseudobacteroides cellulosolvens ATCC 35603 = DSM 2933]
MKSLQSFFLVLVILLCNTFLSSASSINVFYCIDSSAEFNNIKEVFSKSENNMYFQWARLARNKEDKIQFTTKFSFGISKFDNRVEYGIPYKIGNEIREEYSIVSGDTLSSIALKYEVPYKLLGEFNNISDFSSVRVGQKIKIPSLIPDLSRKDDYKAINQNGKVYLSVFFDASDYSDKKNSALEFLNMDDSSWKQNILDPMCEALNTWDFDGVVLDFEGFRDKIENISYSTDNKTGLKEKYIKFLTLLKNSLGNKKLMVVIHPTNVSGYFDGYDIAKINKISDIIILMAYDYQSFERYGASDSTPADLVGKIKNIEASVLSQPYTQPYDKVEGAVNEAIAKGADASKMLLGVNIVPIKWVRYSKNINGKTYYYYTYNRASLEEVEKFSSAEEITNGHLVAKKHIPSGKLSAEEKAKLKLDGSEIDSVEYHYESPESVTLKYERIVKIHNLQGLTVWRLGTGSLRIWESLFSIYGSPAPAGTTKIVLKIGSSMMKVNDTDSEIDPGRGTAPIISNSRTLVPIRTIIEVLGGKVDWDAENAATKLAYKNTNISLTVSSKTIVVNGVSKQSDTAPQIVNGRTYMPLRFLLENLGLKVDWNAQAQTITIVP